MAETMQPPKHMPLTYTQMFGYIFGIVYLGVGAAGFAATEGIGFASAVGGRELVFFSINPLHNLAHIVIGAIFLVAAFTGPRAAKAVATVVGFAYLALAVVGPLLTANPSANILGLNFADDVLHALTAVTALAVVFVLSRTDEYQAA